MSTSPRVPEKLRKEFQSFGPCKDEFLDTDGWPYQLYVREARRMVSDYVMTEHNCRSKEVADDSVGMAAYGMDSHNCQRIVKNSAARNEGDVQEHGLKPYPISYRSIVPRASECENLLVPVCVSATHIAFGSIRMEPVFMVLGQSAGNAAALAIDGNCSVQEVDYQKLRARLLLNGQVLERQLKFRSAASAKLRGQEPGKNSDATKPTIVCFGDSITKRGYPQELSKLLGVEVLNAGVGGNTTRQGLRRMQRDVLDHHPETVVILFGTNDSRIAEEHIHVPLDEYSDNLSELIAACLNQQSRVVLATVPPIDAEPYFERHRIEKFAKVGGLARVLESYRDAALRVAQKFDVPVVDLHRLLAVEPDWMDNDGVHPSEQGNQIIAQLVAEQVKRLNKSPK